MYTLERPFRLAALEAEVKRIDGRPVRWIQLPPEEAVRRYHADGATLSWARERFGISITPEEDLDIARDVRGEGWWRRRKSLEEALKKHGVTAQLSRSLIVCVEEFLRTEPVNEMCEPHEDGWVCYASPTTFLMALHLCATGRKCSLLGQPGKPARLKKLPANVDHMITSAIRNGSDLFTAVNQAANAVFKDRALYGATLEYWALHPQIEACVVRAIRLLNYSFTSAVDFCYRTHCGFSPYAPRFPWLLIGAGVLGLMIYKRGE